MPWNGLGAYLLPPAFTPEVNGTTIDATRYNGATSDVATGISNTIAKDGQNVPTANLPMGGFKHTGAASGTGAGQYMTYGQGVPLGTSALPGVPFVGDLDTGMWSPGANIIAWSVNGSEALRVNSNGDWLVGLTMPFFALANRKNLEIAGTTSALLGFGRAGVGTGYILSNATAMTYMQVENLPMLFGTNNITRMQITAAGVIQDAAGLELGWKDVPLAPNAGAYVLSAANRGVAVNQSDAASVTINTGLPPGQTTTLLNNNAAAQTVIQGAGLTLRLAGTTTTGNRTIAARGMATLLVVTSTEVWISGAGVT